MNDLKVASSVKTLGVDELSCLIFRATATIKNDLYRKPNSLPPRIVMPGSKKLVWLESDVQAWMEQCRAAIEPQKVGFVIAPIKVNLKLNRKF